MFRYIRMAIATPKIREYLEWNHPVVLSEMDANVLECSDARASPPYPRGSSALDVSHSLFTVSFPYLSKGSTCCRDSVRITFRIVQPVLFGDWWVEGLLMRCKAFTFNGIRLNES